MSFRSEEQPIIVYCDYCGAKGVYNDFHDSVSWIDGGPCNHETDSTNIKEEL